jgi:hypothetical protein
MLAHVFVADMKKKLNLNLTAYFLTADSHPLVLILLYTSISSLKTARKQTPTNQPKFLSVRLGFYRVGFYR